MKHLSTATVKVEDGVRFVTINGVKHLFPTYTEITRNYTQKDEFRSFDDYIANRLLGESFMAVIAVLDKKIKLSLNIDFYEKLREQTVRDYRRDVNPDGYCEQIRQLTVTRDNLTKEYNNTHDERVKTMRDRATQTIQALNDLFDDDDTAGNGHDLIYTAYIVLHEYYMRGYRSTDKTINPKNGKSVSVKTLAMRAVNNYITALKRNFSALEDVSDDNDSDEKQSALESVPFIESAYNNFDSIKDFADKYGLTEREQRVSELLTDGYEIKLIAQTIDRDEKTVYKIISKIREKIK